MKARLPNKNEHILKCVPSMSLQCGTRSQVLKVHATFNLGPHDIAIYLVTLVAKGATRARPPHGSGGLHKTQVELSYIRPNLLIREAITCRVSSRMTFSNPRSSVALAEHTLVSCPGLQAVCGITQEHVRSHVLW